jgi:multicomponent Na+:H+ antiporter subunit G
MISSAQLLDWIAAALVAIGVVTMILAATGITRMPDIYMRIQTATKASTLGIASIFVAVAIRFGGLGDIARSLALVAFVVLTVPVAGHALGLAARHLRLPMWSGTAFDDLARNQHQAGPERPDT